LKDAFGFGRDEVHGHSKRGKMTGTYISWKSMIQRCLDPNKDNFSYYGGRGITVDPRWRSFENFLQDMGERPPDTMLGRIDNDGNYKPGNVVWEPSSEHSKNRRNTHWVEHNGENLCLNDFAKAIGTTGNCVRNMLKKGRTIEEIKSYYLAKGEEVDWSVKINNVVFSLSAFGESRYCSCGQTQLFRRKKQGWTLEQIKQKYLIK